MDTLQKIRAAIEAEKEAVYFLNSKPEPGYQLSMILHRVQFLMEMERSELNRLRKVAKETANG